MQVFPVNKDRKGNLDTTFFFGRVDLQMAPHNEKLTQKVKSEVRHDDVYLSTLKLSFV
jgi:hypothetical protein